MELDLDRQEHGRSEIDIDGTLALDLGEGTPETIALNGQLVVQNLESRFLLNGTLRAVGRAQCWRCLGDFELQWEVPVEIMVLRNVDTDEQESETLLILQRRGVVELHESLRECAVLAYPQSPVCSSGCQGLCATCGVDLNRESCACRQEDYDPRWEGLPG